MKANWKQTTDQTVPRDQRTGHLASRIIFKKKYVCAISPVIDKKADVDEKEFAGKFRLYITNYY